MMAAMENSATAQLNALLTGYTSLPDFDLVVSEMSLDSRQVKPGGLFMALPGSQKEGAEFIEDAIGRGACAILVDHPEAAELKWHGEVPIVPIKNLAEHASEIAGRFFGHPSKALWVAGITGTNGKTSCAWWLQQLLNLSGISSASLGTLGVAVGANIRAQSDSLTTADAINLQRRLVQLKAENLESVVMEVSSHGLAQNRVDGIAFDLAIFTNLTQDHLDYHGDLRSYARAKSRLFELPGLGQSLINIDDEFGCQLARSQQDSVELYTYSLSNPEANFYTTRNEVYPFLSAEITTPWGSVSIENSHIFGEHNLANLLCVVAAAAIKGVESAVIRNAIAQLSPVPGRLQRISETGDDIEVVVDFAHTPDAVDKTLATLRETTSGQLQVLLGAGGDRDRSKRPLMAQAVVRHADRLVITSDNPRTEEPAAIAGDMIAGLESEMSAEIILDRGEAISAAIERAGRGDCVAILGKGHEAYQIIGDQRFPFSDADVAAEALARRRGLRQ